LDNPFRSAVARIANHSRSPRVDPLLCRP
jgi:hypothetical protein